MTTQLLHVEIRLSAQALEALASNAPPVSMISVQRATCLRIIGALARAEGLDLSHPVKAAYAIEAMAPEWKWGWRAIEEKLKEVRKTMLEDADEALVFSQFAADASPIVIGAHVVPITCTAVGRRELATFLCIIGAMARNQRLDLSDPVSAAKKVFEMAPELPWSFHDIGDTLLEVPEAMRRRTKKDCNSNRSSPQ